MNYLPHTDAERRDMLRTIGVEKMDALFADVPGHVRYPALKLPSPLSEMELTTAMRNLAEQNQHTGRKTCFLGAGAYEHFIPATVDAVLQRDEFYTAYTPYQAEASQGMLQALFEYQSMIVALTGMEVTNASHYDGATSLAEAVRMALNVAKGARSKVIVSPAVNPRYREVVRTYLQGTDAQIVGEEIPAEDMAGNLDPLTALLDEQTALLDEQTALLDEQTALLDEQTAALVIQSPNFYGQFEEVSGLADLVHAAGALLIVVTDPIALGRFQAPGDYGADVVIADGQPLGIPLSFGGPHLGVFATRREHVHHMPGRLVGETVDGEGRRGYVLTLAAREQHIRRARATSNICTNAGLMAVAAATYLATLGESGLRKVAELCFHKSHYAAQQIADIAGLQINPQGPDKPFFKEFVVALPRPVAEVNQVLAEKFGILGGYDLEPLNAARRGHMLIAVTEMRTKADIDRLVHGLRVATGN